MSLYSKEKIDGVKALSERETQNYLNKSKKERMAHIRKDLSCIFTKAQAGSAARHARDNLSVFLGFKPVATLALTAHACENDMGGTHVKDGKQRVCVNPRHMFLESVSDNTKESRGDYLQEGWKKDKKKRFSDEPHEY